MSFKHCFMVSVGVYEVSGGLYILLNPGALMIRIGFSLHLKP